MTLNSGIRGGLQNQQP